jgi:hypothetical protein
MLYFKKTLVKSVIYLLFSYQTGYIMWCSRLRIYIPRGAIQLSDRVYPWRRKFSRLKVLFICYGTAVEHRSLLNRSGICDGINRCNIFCSCSRYVYYEFSLLHIFSLVIQPWMSAYIRKTDGVYIFSPQKRLKHGRQNITLHWINGIIRNNKCIFTAKQFQ